MSDGDQFFPHVASARQHGARRKKRKDAPERNRKFAALLYILTIACKGAAIVEDAGRGGRR
ncbi:hypothetical protein [Rhizobium sp. G21]|uniref:hypothetical protein n=1 Tax=Rhizobium sp. G21 TaxID=2758439 RepID=UPI0015FF4A53|nr:hypothetical protein [Rhizobium sp. G21]MBB1247789.1 hypothetical protein [Rhizobium sp. G21]